MPARAAVLGSPIGHSKSPALHNAAYQHLGLDIRYDAIDVTEDRLPAFMAGVRSETGWAGLSVTMPLKAAMVAQVDELAGAAAVLQVLNTVTFDGGRLTADADGPDDGSDGRTQANVGSMPGTTHLTGHNTDVVGIVRAIAHAGGTGETSAVILGAGGTSLAAAAALADIGVTDLTLCVRTPSRATETVALAERFGLSVTVVPLRDSAAVVRQSRLVVSTLPPRAGDELAADPVLAGPALADPALAGPAMADPALADPAMAGATDKDGDGDAGVLLDVAYDPWPSALAAAWERRGGKIVPGLEMLLYQGLEQVRLFTGAQFRDEPGVINAMCDAVGLPRRGRQLPDMAG
ncbi:shikimate dehydrogenase family protein [Arthrobacter monumenti]